MKAVLFSLYTITLAFWSGGIAIYSFIVTPVIFKSYSRAEAGTIVGHLFPPYFIYNLVISLLALLFFLFGGRVPGKMLSQVSLALLLLSLILNIFHLTVIHPKAKAIKAQMRAFAEENSRGRQSATLKEDSPGMKSATLTEGNITEGNAAASSFAVIHRISVLMNLIVFLAGIALVVIAPFLRN